MRNLYANALSMRDFGIMRSTRHLMSIEQAAGFAMAPSEDDMAELIERHPDEALRNGHAAASSLAVSELVHDDEHRSAWLEMLTGWWAGGKAHA